MLEDDMPNFPETSPQDDYGQEIEENSPNQVQEFQEIQEVPIQNSPQINENQPYQPQPQNYSEDILLQSSLGGVFDSTKTYATQIISNDQIEMEPKILPPIYQSAQPPLVNIGEQNLNIEEYNNNMNNMNNFKSYSYPIQNNNNIINNTNISDNNPQYATVQPINNEIPNMNNYEYDNNQYANEVNQQYIPNNENNIIYSTPIQIKPKNININQNNNNDISTPFFQSQQLVSPINYTNSNNSNFGSGLENDINANNINNRMDNLNLSDKKNEVTIKLTGKKNNNNYNNSINNNNIKINTNLERSNFLKSGNQNNSFNKINKNNDLDNFSSQGWTLFYPENDPFFLSMENLKDTIPNQRIENPGRNELYIGEVNQARQRHGYGKLITPEFEKEGTWKNNKFNGWGREVRKNGEIYEGKFVNDVLNGKGKYKNRNILYVGDFVNYDQHGKGELFTDKYHYFGDFKRNCFHGFGRIELYDIGVYEGEFNDKEITGLGIFKYSNGDYYEGYMNQGKKEGMGKFTTFDGKTREGKFYNDEFVGKDNLRSNKSHYKKSYKY